MTGSPNFEIDSLPAARVGDVAFCVGPPDRISRGCLSVLIDGAPAARVTDPTIHGGVITDGSGTVIFNDTTPPPLGHSIYFNGTPEQVAAFVRWLDALRATEIGRYILSDIDASSYTLTLQHDANTRATAGTTDYGDMTTADWTAATDGSGVNATVRMDTTIPDHGSHWVFDSSGNQIDFTAEQNFAHEMSHARHVMNGTIDASDPEGQAIGEENIFRQQEVELPPGVAGPVPQADQRVGHGGAPRP